MSYILHHGDCLAVLPTLADSSIDAVVTSPPYALQRKAHYGGIPEANYPAWTVAWMAQVRRVLIPMGSVLINIREHIKDGEMAGYVLRMRLALRDAGWIECDELIWHKPDGVPTGSPARPRRAYERILWFAPTRSPWSNARANGVPSHRVGMAKIAVLASPIAQSYRGGAQGCTPGIARCSDVVHIARASEKTGHPAAYPVALAAWMARLITPPGGIVLDPFAGSCSTGVAALAEGFGFLGIEQDESYCAIGRMRLDAATTTPLQRDMVAR